MEIKKIGENAGQVWRMLDSCGDKRMQVTRLKKDSGMNDAQLWAALGWLAREGKIVIGAQESGKRTITFVGLSE